LLKKYPERSGPVASAWRRCGDDHVHGYTTAPHFFAMDAAAGLLLTQVHFCINSLPDG
jgi:hypothetical protein